MAVTVPAVAEKLPVVQPAATATEAGTVTALFPEESATVEPPVGAACESVTVQVEELPDDTDVGVHTRLVTVTGVTVRDALVEVPLSDAVIVTV